MKSDHSLELAMNECLQASLEEFQPVWQKKLLRVVSFGKVYCEPGSYDADEYTQTVGTLKVLNQIRYSDIGIFITYKELLQIGWEKIIDMLLRRDLHYLALKIIAIIKEDQYIDKVYIHWCCCKITKEMNMSDFELFKIIVEKLKNYSTSTTGRTKSHILKNFISVDEISDVSYQEGRLNLCKLLINLEPSILKKINSFINLGDLELALLKSFQSGDYDVCKLILLQLQEKLTPVQFFKILNQNEQKSTLVDTSLNEIDSDLKNFLHLSDDNKLFIHGDLISNFWLKAIGRFNPTLLNEYYRMEEKQPEVKAIIKETTKTANETTYYEDYKAKLIKIINSHSTSRKDVKVYESELQLLETQRKLSQTYQTDTFFQDKSPIAILIRLINLSQLKQASNISKDFKISKEKYWYLVLDTLTKNGEFEKLYQFILSQNNITTPANESTSDLRSPIGFKYIVDRCLAFRAPKAYISVFIKNCSNIHYTEKIDLFIKNKDLNLAALEAYRFKDIEFLHAIKDKANRESNSQVVSSINTYISRLGY